MAYGCWKNAFLAISSHSVPGARAALDVAMYANRVATAARLAGQRGVNAGAGPAMTSTVGGHQRTLKKPDYFLR